MITFRNEMHTAVPKLDQWTKQYPKYMIPHGIRRKKTTGISYYYAVVDEGERPGC